MAYPLVSVRFPPQLLAEAERMVQWQGYASTQEFIREAVRRQVQEQNLTNLQRLVGVAKGKKITPLTQARRDEIARQVARETPEQQQAFIDRIRNTPRTQAEFEAFLAKAKKKRQ